jgi:hypothetical protein
MCPTETLDIIHQWILKLSIYIRAKIGVQASLQTRERMIGACQNG